MAFRYGEAFSGSNPSSFLTDFHNEKYASLSNRNHETALSMKPSRTSSAESGSSPRSRTTLDFDSEKASSGSDTSPVDGLTETAENANAGFGNSGTDSTVHQERFKTEGSEEPATLTETFPNFGKLPETAHAETAGPETSSAVGKSEARISESVSGISGYRNPSGRFFVVSIFGCVNSSSSVLRTGVLMKNFTTSRELRPPGAPTIYRTASSARQ